MNIGKRLKDIREYNKTAQKTVADFLGIERSNYSKVENDRQKLTPEQIKKFCEFFDVSADYILDIKVQNKVVYDYETAKQVEQRLYEIGNMLNFKKDK